MFCGECGTQNPDTNTFCKNCGKPLKKVQAPAAPAAAQAPQPAPARVQPATGVQAPVKQTWSRGKKLAAGSIALGIVSFIFLPYVLGIAGIILGAFAVRDRYYPGALGAALCFAAMFVSFFYIFLVH
jgi:hypothetical protein